MQTTLDSFAEFNSFRSDKESLESEKWTEADTRSKIIDRLLINCLEWPENSIRRELTIKDERLDYLLSLEKPVLVLEAKRHALTFAIPPKRPFFQIKLSTLLQGNPSLEPDVEQVQGYCSTWSVPYAALTNGKQLLVFCAFRFDGKPWREGVVHVFSDIFGKYDYADLCAVLSRHAYLSNEVYSRFYRTPRLDKAKSVLSVYARPNTTLTPNPLGVAIEPLLRSAFADAVTEDSEEVLRNCYVYPADCRLREEELEALLLDRPPQFNAHITDIQNKNSFYQFGQQLQAYLGIDKPSQIVFVVGGIGVGKTMFIRRFFEIAADDALRLKTTYLYVDFRNPTTDPAKVDTFIVKKIKEAILAKDDASNPSDPETSFDFHSTEALEQIFWPHLQRFYTGPEAEMKKIDSALWEKRRLEHLCELRNEDLEFVKGSIRVMRNRYHRHVVVVIDNADVCNEDYQRAVYLYVRTLLSELKVPIIVALREEWYWHFNRGGGPRTAFHDIVYHIPCPLARDVIAKRLEYAISLVSKYPIPHPTFDLHGMTVQADSMIKYLTILQAALIGSEELGSFYECYANRSIRRGLDIFLDFVRSGHTETDVYLRALMNEGSYRIAFHQFFKSVTRGHYSYYGETNSRMPNVLQLQGRLHRSHFYRLNVLRYLYNHRRYRNVLGDGFIEKPILYELTSQVGIDNEDFTVLINYFLMNELVEADNRKKFYQDDALAFRITVLGGLLCDKLIRRFEYLEMVLCDTSIQDESLVQLLLETYKEGVKPAVMDRLKAVKAWIKYLQHEEQIELSGRKGCQVFGLSPLGPSLDQTCEKEEQRIIASIARNSRMKSISSRMDGNRSQR